MSTMSSVHSVAETCRPVHGKSTAAAVMLRRCTMLLPRRKGEDILGRALYPSNGQARFWGSLVTLAMFSGCSAYLSS